MQDKNALVSIQIKITGESKEGNGEIEDNPLCLREKYDISSKIFG